MAAQRTTTKRDEVPGESDITLQAPAVSVEKVDGRHDIVEVVVSRTFTVKTGEYESMASFASAKMLVDSKTDFDAIALELADVLDIMQGPDLSLAKTVSKNRQSMIHGLLPN